MNLPKKDVNVVLDSLKRKKSAVDAEKASVDSAIQRKIRIREGEAKLIVMDLIPDLREKTITELEKKVPGFRIPRVSSFIIFEKVDPNITLATARANLRSYLDSLTYSPPLWVTVEEYGDDIKKLIDKKDKLYQQSYDLSKKIKAIEGLDQTVSLMLPKERQAFVQKFTTQVRRIESSPPVYVTTTINQSSGPDLLDMLIWNEILSPSQTYSAAPAAPTWTGSGGGGDFGGGGADSTWAPQSNSDSNGVGAGIAAAALMDSY